MTDLLDQDAAAIASAVRANKVKTRDVAEAAVARVEARNKALTAIVDFDPSEARAAADSVYARRSRSFDGPILGVPYLLTPTSACVAWPVEHVYLKVIENREVGPRGHAVFTPLFNLALVPGISVPCGAGRDGLPVGLQIVAPRLHDRPLLAMARRAETALAR